MPTEQNKALVRRYFEVVFVNRNLAAIDKIFAADYINHQNYDPSGEEVIHGSEGFKDVARMYFSAFPDHSCTVEDQIAEGDKVVTRWTTRGTHKGFLMGIAPTNKRISVT